MELAADDIAKSLREHFVRTSNGLFMLAGATALLFCLIGLIRFIDNGYLDSGVIANLYASFLIAGFATWMRLRKIAPENLEIHNARMLLPPRLFGEEMVSAIPYVRSIWPGAMAFIGKILPTLTVNFKIEVNGVPREMMAFFFFDAEPIIDRENETIYVAVGKKYPYFQRWVISRYWSPEIVQAAGTPRPFAEPLSQREGILQSIRDTEQQAAANPKAALKQAERLARLHPDVPEVQLLIASVLAAGGKKTEGVTKAQALLLASLQKGDGEFATAIYRKFISQRHAFNLSAQAGRKLAELLLKAGEYDGAVWACHRMIKKGGDKEQGQKAIIAIAKTAAQNGEGRAAVGALQSIVDLYPESTFVAACTRTIGQLRANPPKKPVVTTPTQAAGMGGITAAAAESPLLSSVSSPTGGNTAGNAGGIVPPVEKPKDEALGPMGKVIMLGALLVVFSLSMYFGGPIVASWLIPKEVSVAEYAERSDDFIYMGLTLNGEITGSGGGTLDITDAFDRRYASFRLEDGGKSMSVYYLPSDEIQIKKGATVEVRVKIERFHVFSPYSRKMIPVEAAILSKLTVSDNEPEETSAPKAIQKHTVEHQ